MIRDVLMPIRKLLERILPDLSSTGPPPEDESNRPNLPSPKTEPELRKHLERTRDAANVLDAQATVIIRERTQRRGRRTLGQG